MIYGETHILANLHMKNVGLTMGNPRKIEFCWGNPSFLIQETLQGQQPAGCSKAAGQCESWHGAFLVMSHGKGIPAYINK